MHRHRRQPVAAPTVVRTALPPTYREIILQSYATPARHDMAVILVVFNPGSSVRIIQNLLLVKQKLETAGIPTYVAELAFPTQSHIFPPAANIFQFRSDSYLFYKENLINLAEQRIPPHFSKICTLDADIIFAQPDWYDKVSMQLDTHDLCQIFQTANYLDITFSAIIKSDASILNGGHPGFGWAARRSFFRTCGFPEFAVVGSGDAVLSGYKKPIYNKECATYNTTPMKTTFASGITVYHLNHGPLEARQYSSRHDMMAAYLRSIGKAAISDILYKRDDGLLEFLPEFRQSANAIMLSYFNGRVDDAI